MAIKLAPPVGTKAFREAWERVTANHTDDWGVNCAYDFEGWKLWKAAIQHERKRAAETQEVKHD